MWRAQVLIFLAFLHLPSPPASLICGLLYVITFEILSYYFKSRSVSPQFPNAEHHTFL